MRSCGSPALPRRLPPRAAVVKYDEPEEIETALGFIAIPTTSRPLFPGALPSAHATRAPGGLVSAAPLSAPVSHK